MFKTRVFMTVIAMTLVLGGAAYALTQEEARTRVEKQAADKGWTAQERSQATETLQKLVQNGVPVEHAYRVVEASINQGIKGQELAEIARTMEKNTKSGMASQKAADEAIQSMDRIRTRDRERAKTMDKDMTQDRIQDRDRVKQDTGSGFGSGSGMGGGSGMGHGSGMPATTPGMGGHK
mgnify:CR=1 FL=1